MTAKRSSAVLMGALAALSLAVVGCGKDEGKTGDKGAETAGKAAPGAEGAGAKKSAPAGGAKAYAAFPKDVQMLVGLNGDKLRKSAVFNEMVKPMLAKNLGKGMDKLKDCGIDPVESFGAVVFGASQSNKEKTVARVSGFSRAAVTKCAEANKEEMTLKVEGDVMVMQDGDKVEAVLAWVDDNTFLAGPDRGVVEAAAKGAGGADTNAVLMGLASHADTSSALWVAGLTPAGMPMPMGLPAISGGFVNVDLATGLKVHVGAKTGSADDAKKALDKANEMMTMASKNPMAAAFAKYLTKVQLKSDGDMFVIDINLSLADLKELQGMAPMFMGAMGGM